MKLAEKQAYVFTGVACGAEWSGSLRCRVGMGTGQIQEQEIILEILNV
jgi:hypothetical protein